MKGDRSIGLTLEEMGYTQEELDEMSEKFGLIFLQQKMDAL